jgi:hypothetical protein
MQSAEMRELLITQGWEYVGTCDCSGKPKKYAKPNFLFKLYERKNRWELFKQGALVSRGADINLKEQLDAIQS